MNKRTALITGAAHGLGRALTLKLLQDYHIIALDKDKEGLLALDNQAQEIGFSLTLIHENLLKFSALDQIGLGILQRFQKLDLLIGNAAILGYLSPLTHMLPKDFQKIMDVNFTANWRLLRSVEPLLYKSPQGKCFFITCDPPEKTAFWGIYNASKAALEALITSYASEKQNTSLKVHLYVPPIMPTLLRNKAFPGEPTSLNPNLDNIAEDFLTHVMADDPTKPTKIHYDPEKHVK